MTPLSPLQLKQHFFVRFSILPNPGGTIQGAQILEPTISFDKSPQAPNQWALGLRITLKSAKPEAPTLYEADIEMFGIVEVHNDFPPEKSEQLAVVNGLGLLYSAIREMFLNVTARSANGALSLPILNFVGVLPSRTQADAPAPTPGQPQEAAPNPAPK